MARTLDPLQFVLMAMAGWMNQRQQQVIEYLQEENRVLREQTGKRRLRFSDDQRRRLAVKAKVLGRKTLSQLDTLVMPDTLLNWHRKLIAEKYDGSLKRRPGRPQVRAAVQRLVVRLAKENRRWGISTYPRCTIACGIQTRGEHDRRDSAPARCRTGAGAQPKDQLEGVSGAALGTDCSG